jgi:hypothetical protein
MPADLRGDHKLDLATIFGNGSRFSFTSPKCVLLADAKPKERSFTFAPDCHVVGRQIIARLINIPLRAGAKIAFAINGAGTRMIPILRSHNGQQLMSATIANIVSLNSFHSGFIRDE